MSISNRQNSILEILNERHYITVEELAKITFTSPSSIRRDLTYLQNNGLVKRSHGGVTLPEPIKGVASFHDRIQKNIREKRLIAKKAATLLRDGQSILLDGSSTASFMLPFIAKLVSPTLFTNNLTTALNAIELGIETHCIGGHSLNGSAVLTGPEAYRFLEEVHTDILFFSSQCVDIEGNISDSVQEETYVRQRMLKAAKTKVFLCDSEKFGKTALYRLASMDEVDFAVFDRDFDGLDAKCNVL